MLIRDILGKISDNQIRVYKLGEDDVNAIVIYEGQASSYDNDENLFIVNIFASGDVVCIEVE